MNQTLTMEKFMEIIQKYGRPRTREELDKYQQRHFNADGTKKYTPDDIARLKRFGKWTGE